MAKDRFVMVSNGSSLIKTSEGKVSGCQLFIPL